MERFYHIRPRRHDSVDRKLDRGGATIRLVSTEDHPLHVEMQYTMCSPKEYFSKKLGRLYCTGGILARQVRGAAGLNGHAYTTINPAAVSLVHIRDLPGEFRHIWKMVHKKMKVQFIPEEVPSFQHLVRDWLPDYDVQRVPPAPMPASQVGLIGEGFARHNMLGALLYP